MKNIALRRIITRGVLDMETLRWLKEEERSRLYLGPIAEAMLDANQGGSLVASSLLDPQVITTTTSSPSGYWRDVSQDEGYILVVVSFGTITATSATVQMQSSASATGSNPVTPSAPANAPADTSGAYPYYGLFPTVLAAASPTQQTLLFPAAYFANRYVGAQVTVAGTGNVPVSIVLLGSGDKL